MLEEIQIKSIDNICYIKSFRNYCWSTHLDLLRGVAALQVFISHVRVLFFVDYPQISNPNPILKAFYFFTGFGHESVMIFFVLSGFFISSSVLRTIQENKWSWINYLVNRLTRLYVVLIPALLLSAFWDFMGINIFGTGQNSLYGGKFLGDIPVTYNILESFNLPNFLGTLTFLQTIFVDLPGSNKPVWSLAYEFWYYIAFPLIILLFCVKSLKLRIIYASLTLLLSLMVGAEIRLYFLIWLMGALISLCPTSSYLKKQFVLPLLIFLSSLILCISLSIARLQLTNRNISDFFIGIAVAIFIYLLINNRSQIKHKGVYEKFSESLAGCSYTLYLVHLPFLAFIRACFISERRWEPDIFHVGIVLLILVFVFLYAVLIAHFTESKTDKVRNLVMSWIKNRRLIHS